MILDGNVPQSIDSKTLKRVRRRGRRSVLVPGNFVGDILAALVDLETRINKTAAG